MSRVSREPSPFAWRTLSRGAALAATALLLTACAGTPEIVTSSSAPPAPAPSASAPSGPELLPFPTGPSQSSTALPGDCDDLLDARIRDELEGVPLNAPGMGGGLRPDSSRVCVWGEPGAAGTWLAVVVGYAPLREAHDALYELGNDGYTCYEPQGGIRCERTWDHPTLPVEQGRTLFYRDGVIIDTQYSNLAPSGFTDTVIRTLWSGAVTPGTSATPTP